eukprot:Rhum_TRINITY_DN14813_c6_g1::Rhum_TRINITY_DN14813_c6_g1_i1::g.120526::m.120526
MALQAEDVSSLGDLKQINIASVPCCKKWGDQAGWLSAPSQRPYFVDTVCKVNRKDRNQDRVLVLTRNVVASCRANGKVTRAFPVGDVQQVWVENRAYKGRDARHVVLKVPKQYDLYCIVDAAKAEQLLVVLSALLLEVTGNTANIRNVIGGRIGEGDLPVSNAKPKRWQKGEHLVYVAPIVGTAGFGGGPAAAGAGEGGGGGGEVCLEEVDDSDESPEEAEATPSPSPSPPPSVHQREDCAGGG